MRALPDTLMIPIRVVCEIYKYFLYYITDKTACNILTLNEGQGSMPVAGSIKNLRFYS